MKTYDTEKQGTYCTIVSENGKYGLIDKKRKEITKIIYEEIREGEGIDYLVRVGDKWGTIDGRNGEQLIPTKYDGFKFTDGNETFVSQGNKWGIWDNGKQVIAPQYDEIIWLDTHPDYWRCRIGENWGIISTRTWKEIIPCKYDWVEQTKLIRRVGFVSEVSSFGIIVKKSGSFYLLNIGDGKSFPSIAYDSVLFGNDLVQYTNIPAERTSKWGLISGLTGKILIPIEYDAVPIEDDGNYRIRKGDKWGFASLFPDGRTAISKNIYDEISTDVFHFPNSWNQTQLRGVRIGMKWGVYDPQIGKEILPAIFDQLSIPKHGVIATRSSNLWGLWSASDGKQMVPVKYEEIGELEETFVHVRIGDKWINYKYENR